MELIDRYLQAVEFWLPTEQKRDIIAELSEDIYAQVEEQGVALGRKLNEAEVEAILKRRGSPVLVANRYLPQQHLIGPVLFPIYRFVLKVVTLCYLLPWLVVSIILIVSGRASLSILASLWTAAFVSTGMVTLVFAILERVQARSHFLEDWNPRKLPPIHDSKLRRLTSAYIELAANLIALLWWATKMYSPITLSYMDLHISLAPLWSYFFWGFLLTTLFSTMLSAANIMHPFWTPRKATFRLLIDCGGALLFCWLVKANIVTAFSVTGVSSNRAIEIANAINLHLAQTFPAAIMLLVVIAACDAYRIMRLKTPKVRLTGVTDAYTS